MNSAVEPLQEYQPDSQLNNLYEKDKGHYIYLHTDNRGMFGDTVVSISLLGNCNLVMQNALEVVYVPFPRRSLLLMTREARYEWKHGIPNEELMDNKRISITFREIKKEKDPSLQTIDKWMQKNL
jgi:alkylated DNA repair protein alkB family protein 8